MMGNGLQLSSVSSSPSPRATNSKVFIKNNNTSGLNSKACACIVAIFGQQHRQATAKMVSCVLPEISMCCTQSKLSLAWKMVTCEMPVQYEMSRTSSVVDDCIIWRKCRSVTCVDAKFRFVRYLNTQRGMKRYKAPLADRSRSSHSQPSISLNLLIVDHHSKRVPAARARPFRFRNWKTYIQITDEVFISI